MQHSDSIKELASAFCKAQASIAGAIKGKTNPAFRSKYADLGSVVDAVKPALSENGLAFVQIPHDMDSAASVETILLHDSGEWMSLGAVTVPVTKADAQGYGSALTYARRYGLMTAFGVPTEDDDGNAAAVAAPKAPTADEIGPVTAKLEEAAKRGTKVLQETWAALPNTAKVALKDLKESLKHRAADVDAHKEAA